jgi:GMP synthase-like glutamine amidotransferase
LCGVSPKYMILFDLNHFSKRLCVKKKPHILVIDPAIKTPELASFNLLARMSALPLTYHLPALQGFSSLELASDSINGIIILGSLSSVNESLAWQKQLGSFLLPHLENQVPTLGICYGHQFIAHLFGGKVDYVFPDKKKHLGFRTVSLKSNSLWGEACSGPLYVSHNEQVTKLPEGFDVIASSPEIEMDGLAHRKWPIWTFQPHPEAGPKFLELREKRLAQDPTQFDFGHQLLQQFLHFCSRNK